MPKNGVLRDRRVSSRGELPLAAASRLGRWQGFVWVVGDPRVLRPGTSVSPACDLRDIG